MESANDATPTTLQFTGRFLFLTQDPDQVRSQLDGADLDLASAGALRNDVSTDEITPVTVMLTYDERLGRYPYVGLQCEGRRPVAIDDVRQGGFEITVAGKRYGKGSSRESSPLAELYAGIRLIIAESFERIYQQNCDNVGILTSTDFSLVERIRNGEAIEIDEFLGGRDALTRQIVRAGGLLKYSRAASWPRESLVRATTAQRVPMTLVEKIIERKRHPDTPPVEPGTGIFVAADWRFSHDYFTGMSAHFMHRAFGNPAPVYAPERIVAFHDHLVMATQSFPHRRDNLLEGVAHLVDGHRQFAGRYPIRVHQELPDGSGSEGICHVLMAERYALPGQVVVGTDSHTPHSGALGCLAFGVGSTEMANSWVTGYARCKVPETLRVQIDGPLPPGVTAKDIALKLLRRDDIRSGAAIGCVFEYCGSTVEAMSVDERATLTNMVAELGGFTGIVAPDEKTRAFLRERRGIDFEIEPWMASDAGARYRGRISLDASRIKAMVARPGDPSNGVAVDLLDEPVRVDIAYGGSCTAGKREDFDAYHEVLAWGLMHGLSLAPHTELFLQFGTVDVREYCASRHYLETFERAGATLLMPGCGACANCGPGQSTRASQVTISAINRNFPGRSGPGSVWLGSPHTVVASALSGVVKSFEQLQADVLNRNLPVTSPGGR